MICLQSIYVSTPKFQPNPPPPPKKWRPHYKELGLIPGRTIHLVSSSLGSINNALPV